MPRRDVCFLTGPNMAGKSTYMKTLGMAVYLAHVGLPVPADRHADPEPFRSGICWQRHWPVEDIPV